jgi:hypothetical protein
MQLFDNFVHHRLSLEVMYLLVSSAKLLDVAYRTEKGVDVRERLFLVKRVLVDNEHS